jgi:hypothetical protein
MFAVLGIGQNLNVLFSENDRFKKNKKREHDIYANLL